MSLLDRIKRQTAAQLAACIEAAEAEIAALDIEFQEAQRVAGEATADDDVYREAAVVADDLGNRRDATRRRLERMRIAHADAVNREAAEQVAVWEIEAAHAKAALRKASREQDEGSKAAYRQYDSEIRRLNQQLERASAVERNVSTRIREHKNQLSKERYAALRATEAGKALEKALLQVRCNMHAQSPESYKLRHQHRAREADILQRVDVLIGPGMNPFKPLELRPYEVPDPE